MDEFDSIISKVYELWNLQSEKAEMALKLMDEAEEIEKEIYDNLRQAKEINSERYDEFLKSFGDVKSD